MVSRRVGKNVVVRVVIQRKCQIPRRAAEEGVADNLHGTQELDVFVVGGRVQGQNGVEGRVGDFRVHRLELGDEVGLRRDIGGHKGGGFERVVRWHNVDVVVEFALGEKDLGVIWYVGSVGGDAVDEFARCSGVDHIKVDGVEGSRVEGAQFRHGCDAGVGQAGRFLHCQVVSQRLVQVELEGGRLDNGPLERKRGVAAVRCNVVNSAGSACTLSDDGDLVWVASKQTNILLNPIEGDALIIQPEVGGDILSAEPAEHTKTVVDRNKDDALTLIEVRAGNDTSG